MKFFLILLSKFLPQFKFLISVFLAHASLFGFTQFPSPASGLQSLYAPEDYLLYDHFQKFLFLKFSLSPIIQAFWSTSTIHSFSHVPWLSAVVFSITSSPFTAWPQECSTWNTTCYMFLYYYILRVIPSSVIFSAPLKASFNCIIFQTRCLSISFQLILSILCQKSHGSKGIKKGYPFFGKTIYCLLVLFTLLSKFRFV